MSRRRSDEVTDAGADEAPEPHLSAWCASCDVVRPLADTRPGLDGGLVCRTCGDAVTIVEDDDAAPAAPWHFKVLLVGTIGYLIYRLIWFIEWISHH